MDVNYLLAREQVSILRASTATDPSARFAHREFARQYGLLLAGSSYPHRVTEESLEVGPEDSIPAASGGLGE